MKKKLKRKKKIEKTFLITANISYAEIEGEIIAKDEKEAMRLFDDRVQNMGFPTKGYAWVYSTSHVGYDSEIDKEVGRG
jgi:hypothetical protein